MELRLQTATKPSKKDDDKDAKEEFSVGLIVPHTNFGKREYSRAITSALQQLQKIRSTKLNFLNQYSFQANNVLFDMMPLTPSPTSKYCIQIYLVPS